MKTFAERLLDVHNAVCSLLDSDTAHRASKGTTAVTDDRLTRSAP